MTTVVDSPVSAAAGEPADNTANAGSAGPAGPADPLGRLQALARAKTLAAGYAEVAPLLAEVARGDNAAADLVRAGRVLSKLSPAAILEHHPAQPVVKVAVAGHSTVAALVPPLTAELARHGQVLDITLGDFDGYLRELQDTGSQLYASGLDLALVVLDPQAVFDELPEVWRVEDLEQATAAKLAQLDRLAEKYVGNQPTATLVLNTLPLQRTHTHQLVDLRSRAALGIVWREFNAGLLRLAVKHQRVAVIDFDPLVAAGGPVGDPRMASYAKAHLGDELLGRYAREVAHLTRTIKALTKKVLVLDLDNTLWDGILGDDGADGIEMATTYRGEAFGNFQRVAKQIGSQGVLLAVSSKNDHEPVLEVLSTHPDMVLRDTDFVRVNANWNPKDANLRDIAARLNLGVDSFVFADDSPFETGLIAASLPEVAVVRLDEEPALHIGKLLADGWFDVLELTAEDRERAALYRTDAARQDLLDSSDNFEEYLANLGVTLTVAPVSEAEVARVSQLSLRSNQCNLTTLRMQPDTVRELAQSPDHLVLYLRSGDKFGDNGLIGALFCTKGPGGSEGAGLTIDNYIMSCRVLSRGIEQAAIGALLAHARDAGLGPVHASYRPTKKNHRVRNFWPSFGFERHGGTDEAPDYRHDLAALPEIPGHLRLDASFER
ncbi:MAG TPA: HAD-IIIC family phosphatase [Actinocrinis sp.]|uniref:HAD-IIIC family phosphatase n=1 Tax=Actinocrinis sp. TaxID=1920516 RepID=UPI002D419782|nr:HAD-IIIC family phosphatase [Actinocrinis sp.]HZU55377.1 HAD-IIIC family phosphatase [Actinocrinis sp.]